MHLKKTIFLPGLTLVSLICAAPSAVGNPSAYTVFDFGKDFDPSRMSPRDAKVTLVPHDGGRALQVEIPEGWKNAWPGVTLEVPATARDLSAYGNFRIEVENSGKHEMLLGVQIESSGGEKARRRNVRKFPLIPGKKQDLFFGTFRLPPERTQTVPLLWMDGLPPWAGGDKVEILDMGDVRKINIYVTRPTQALRFLVKKIRAAGNPPSYPVGNPLPFVDRYGQYIHDDWPGKIHTDAELAARTRLEREELARHPGPTDRTRWGGWKTGPTLEATGFFRVAEVKGRWWFVDPEGKLFIMHGMHGVRFGTPTPVRDREAYFADYPGKDPFFREFEKPMITLLTRGYYPPGQPVLQFDFYSANLKRKYGKSWREQATDVAFRRLRSWGFTTLGANGHPSFHERRVMPYYFYCEATRNLRTIAGSSGSWGKFPDAFDAGFAEKVKVAFANESRVKAAAGDPWCIGFGVDNELAWADAAELGSAALRSPVDQPAKLAYIKLLQERHGDVNHLNAAWGTSYGGWEALQSSTQVPDARRAVKDHEAFSLLLAKAYFSACRNAVKAAAPRQLYLGCRFAKPAPHVTEVAAEYCDVVSFNHYAGGVDGLSVGRSKPFLIGEFHFGAPGLGYFSPAGLVEVADRAEQASAYKDYWQSVLRHPSCVGANWFMYGSECVSGAQAASENLPIGFVDMADTPNPVLVAAAREIGASMYRIRSEEE